ncbi:putative amidoligase enzyme-domain-containing protein [Camillea tinctor]|nr:putative amidoligase enzyme-domain-containing protein [Camillea tinctor]
MAEPGVVGKHQLTIPVGERHSFGVELEFLVAHLPTKAVDPDQRIASCLPPLLRIDQERQWSSTVAVLEHIRQTLRDHGISVAEPTTVFTRNEGDNLREPQRLRGLDKWDIGTDETVKAIPSPQDNGDKYRWTGIEVRSPALWAMSSSFDEVKLVVNLLKSRYRLRVNLTCGLHVHVANGRQFFSPKTMKRLGAFLWAADPMLSRLHAPWRRVGSYCQSIRYGSKLALRELEPADARMMVRQATRIIREERNQTLDPLPDLPWSDTTREEKEFGGKKGWEEHARLWRKTAPKMRLPEVGNKVSSGPGLRTGPSSSSEARSNSSSSPSFSFRSGSGPGTHRNSTSAPKSDKVVPDGGGAHDRVLLSAMQTETYRDMCYEWVGHRNPEKLSPSEQQHLLALVHCQELFGHQDLPSLTAEEEAEIFALCGPYVEALRSVWKWDIDTERWNLNQCHVGDILKHVRPKQNVRVNGPRVVGRLENVAALLDLDNQEDLEYVTREELDTARQSNKGYEALIDSLRDYVASPDIDNDSTEDLDDDELDDLIDQYEKEIEDDEAVELGSQRSRITLGASGNKSLQTSAQGKSQRPTPAPENSPPKTNPPSPPPSPPPPSAPKRRRRRPHQKLRPHDISQLPASYISSVSAHAELTAADWDRISWLPSRHPDPVADRPARTRTLHGCAALLACGSAAEVGALLCAPDAQAGKRLNYNFEAYAPEGLGERYGYPCRRTLEFREAGGSLDAEGVVRWARICVGIVRWCRDAEPGDYVALLGDVVRWEEEREGEVRFDVCDLLDRMGLAAEAEGVRMRERKRGPPR